MAEVDIEDRPDTLAAPIAACLVCGGACAPSRTLPGLLTCMSCGFITADVALTESEQAALYGHDYFHGQEYLDYALERDALRANFRGRLATMRAVDADLGRARLLEIGCSYGYFLELVRGAVGAAQGIDVAAEAVARARAELGVDAQAGSYLDTAFPQPFDWIVMWDTIEHLLQPGRFIAKAAADLRPGGFLALTTGDIGSLNARFRGRRWRMIHPPTHLHYFSVATVRRLLAAHGLEVVHVSHPGTTRSVRSILYLVLALRMGRRRWYEAIERMPFARLSIPLNLGDIMFVIARRSGSDSRREELPCRK